MHCPCVKKKVFCIVLPFRTNINSYILFHFHKLFEVFWYLLSHHLSIRIWTLLLGCLWLKVLQDYSQGQWGLLSPHSSPGEDCVHGQGCWQVQEAPWLLARDIRSINKGFLESSQQLSSLPLGVYKWLRGRESESGQPGWKLTNCKGDFPRPLLHHVC